MAIYEVTVPFERIVITTMHSAQWSHLPDSFKVGEILCDYDPARKIGSAKLEVEASDPTEAKEKAERKVRLAFGAFALEGHAFRVVYGPGFQAEERASEPPPIAEPDSLDTGNENCRTVALGDHGIIEGAEQIWVEKRVESVDFANQVVSRYETLPDHRLKRAIELNYIATVTPEEWAAFLIRYAALELIVEYLAGSDSSLIEARLQNESQRDSLLQEVRNMFSRYGFTDEEIRRLEGRLRETQQRSRRQRFVHALQTVGVTADLGEIDTVIRVRNAIAHQGRTPETKDEDLAFARAREWVQAALFRLLSENTSSIPQR
ncbi:hypothetical protein NET02_04865 [Thermomicrobiaceae bacterium CFH 74404]|uniref:Uncharacterized protein n=1 Tax=Thermalbibacter longus TaxID=2951981 RepID=A0AA42BAE6_9BACT|nr:hypothetical protein [Thermalbibacter longus]MCM8748469.1 hypothetical protein [Thermalbibacter longus]